MIHTNGPNGGTPQLENLLGLLEDAYNECVLPEDLKSRIFGILNSRIEYRRALQRFDELCNENPDATMSEIYDWFVDLDILVEY